MAKSLNILASFGFATQGIAYALRTQRNFQIHCGITLAVVIVGLIVGLPPEQWAILLVMIAVVFQAELMNTALEAIVDKVSPEFHSLAKIAKDCAAGAVFISAGIAVIVGLLIFGPRLIALVR